MNNIIPGAADGTHRLDYSLTETDFDLDTTDFVILNSIPGTLDSSTQEPPTEESPL